MDLHALRERLIAFFADQPDVAAAYLFGSVARGEATPRSDLDVAVLLAPAPSSPQEEWERREALSKALSRIVGRPVDVVILNRAPRCSAIRCCGKASGSTSGIRRPGSSSRCVWERSTRISGRCGTSSIGSWDRSWRRVALGSSDDMIRERLRWLRSEVAYLKSERDKIRSLQAYVQDARLKRAVERTAKGTRGDGGL